jgi:hypothetical protein
LSRKVVTTFSRKNLSLQFFEKRFVQTFEIDIFC